MRTLAVALVVLVLGSPSHAQKPSSPIENLMAQWVVAFNALDAAKVAAFYAEDAVWMPQETPMIRGRVNIEAALKKAFERGGVLKLAIVESRVGGATAFAAGTFTVARGAAVLPAKFLTVFKRVGNEWKIAYDMQNADQPRPAP